MVFCGIVLAMSMAQEPSGNRMHRLALPQSSDTIAPWAALQAGCLTSADWVVMQETCHALNAVGRDDLCTLMWHRMCELHVSAFTVSKYSCKGPVTELNIRDDTHGNEEEAGHVIYRDMPVRLWTAQTAYWAHVTSLDVIAATRTSRQPFSWSAAWFAK